jgi:sorting nexin-29
MWPVIPLFRKGLKNYCNNYRGISVVNSGHRIYAKIINERLKTIMDAVLLEEQQGFRKGASTVDKILVVQQIIGKICEFNVQMCIDFLQTSKKHLIK